MPPSCEVQRDLLLKVHRYRRKIGGILLFIEKNPHHAASYYKADLGDILQHLADVRNAIAWLPTPIALDCEGDKLARIVATIDLIVLNIFTSDEIVTGNTAALTHALRESECIAECKLPPLPLARAPYLTTTPRAPGRFRYAGGLQNDADPPDTAALGCLVPP